MEATDPFYQICHFNVSCKIISTGTSSIPFVLAVKIIFQDGHAVTAERNYSHRSFPDRSRVAVLHQILPDAIIWFQAYHGRAADLKPRVRVFIMMLQEVIQCLPPFPRSADAQHICKDLPNQLSLF